MPRARKGPTGNRTVKSDDQSGVVTNYTYDYTAPLTYDSQGNRLVYSDTWAGGVQVEERWYRYDLEGRTDLVIRRIETDEDASGNQWYRGTRMYYNTSGQIWNALSERWQVAGGRLF